MTGAKSYISASADFASGKSSPRDFLEAALAAIDAREGEIEAFVARLDPAIARARADEASKRWRNGAQRSSPPATRTIWRARPAAPAAARRRAWRRAFSPQDLERRL
jgi:hypothetical protein